MADRLRPDLRIQEHSLACPEPSSIITMLWDAAESDAPRPAEATLRTVAMCLDYLLVALEENQILSAGEPREDVFGLRWGYTHVMNKLIFCLTGDPRETALRDATYRAVSRATPQTA